MSPSFRNTPCFQTQCFFRPDKASSVEIQVPKLGNKPTRSGNKSSDNVSPVSKPASSDNVVRGGQKQILNNQGWKEGVLLNIRGLYPNNNKSKIQYLNDLTKDSNLLFLALTETHLNKNILDAEIQIGNYNLFRQDRKDRSHGGTACYVHSSLCANIVESRSDCYCEIWIVEISDLDLIVATIYRPPNCPAIKFKANIDLISKYLYIQSSSVRMSRFLSHGP